MFELFNMIEEGKMTISWDLKTLGVILSISTVSLFVYYRLYQRTSARLVYGDSRSMVDPVRRRLAEKIEDIVKLCPELSNPKYIPTFWAANQWANLVLFLVKEQFDIYFRADIFSREILTLSDGGTVSIDFSDDTNLCTTAPILMFLHTVTGSSRDTSHFVRYATSRGWRGCVFNRRGHGEISLTSPSFNCMGDASDTKAQVDFVTTKFPSASYLAMVGISAGSGLVLNYLGKEGEKTPIQAACSLCPAYDITQAFTKLADLYPVVDRHLLSSVKNHFLTKNRQILSSKSQAALDRCYQAKTTHEFLTANYSFAGCDSVDDYFAANNPMEWVEGIVRPFMLVNSEDDMVCLPKNIQEDVVVALGGALLLRTRKGSHIAFNEGVLGTGSYLARITMDFLEAARISENVDKS